MIIYGLQQSKLSTRRSQTDSQLGGIREVWLLIGNKDGGYCEKLVKAAATKLTLNSHSNINNNRHKSAEPAPYLMVGFINFL